MTRKLAAGCFVAMFGLAVSAGAQTPPPQDPQNPTQPPPPTSPYPSQQAPMDRSSSRDSKLTGCVAAGTETGSFELTNIKKGMKDHQMPSTAGEAASAGAGMAAKSVKLMASPSVDLSAHVGHTVELSGSWSKGARGAADAASSASSPQSAASGAADAMKSFNVTNVKMVSSTCQTGTQ